MNGLQICCPGFEAAVVDDHIFCEEDGEVSVPGCCGGGCNILSDIKHCPYCGRRIQLTIGTISKVDDGAKA